MKPLAEKLILSVVMGGCLLGVSSGWAVDVYLRAAAFDNTLPGGKVVKMWGFALEDATWNAGNSPTSPGPRINVPADASGDTLVIHLRNALSVPVSIVIPNQNGFLLDAPHGTFVDTQGRTRARSFVKEAAPPVAPALLGDEVTYTWNKVTPGTYLYFSGSHSSLQVQMGLYGAMVRKTSDTENDVLLLFSEIDTKVHDAVAANDYGPSKAMTSTIHSVPDYFLINGVAYTSGQPALAAGTAGQTVLLRMLNASVNSRIPVIYGLDQTIIAEDGRLYPYPRNLTAPELPALKTMDVLVSPATAGTYPLYDRALGLANGTTSPGGMLTYLRVAAPSPTPSPTPVPATAALQKNRTNVAN